MGQGLKMCECESEVCERKDAHECGSCNQEARFRISIFGMKQNLCEECNETAKGFFNATDSSYMVLGDVYNGEKPEILNTKGTE